MKKYLSLIALLFFVGCKTSVFNDISNQKAYREYIGTKLQLKRDVLVTSDQKFNSNLKQPNSQFYPTIEEYQKTGKTRKSFFNNEKIVGIVKAGTILKIEAIGLVNTGVTMGERGVIKMIDLQSGNSYYLHEPDLFSFEGSTIVFNSYYFK